MVIEKFVEEIKLTVIRHPSWLFPLFITASPAIQFTVITICAGDFSLGTIANTFILLPLVLGLWALFISLPATIGYLLGKSFWQPPQQVVPLKWQILHSFFSAVIVIELLSRFFKSISGFTALMNFSVFVKGHSVSLLTVAGALIWVPLLTAFLLNLLYYLGARIFKKRVLQ